MGYKLGETGNKHYLIEIVVAEMGDDQSINLAKERPLLKGLLQIRLHYIKIGRIWECFDSKLSLKKGVGI